ncbi:integrase [Azohydromonas lata]|uniref:integrase n=1 Tax=Azohydromonas lata TaxID=45677 RepID=UPI00082C8E11|nr:integrase [Azohydromonas lata]
MQPVSVAGLSQAERDRIVVTAVADGQGNEHPVTHFGDPVWDLTVEAQVTNKRLPEFHIAWPTDVAQDLVNDTKAVLYCALRRGRIDGRPWSASAVASTGRETVPLLRYLSHQGLRNFSEVRALHLSDYLVPLRGKIKPSTLRRRLDVVDMVWGFPDEVLYPLTQHPWAGSTLHHVCHYDNNGVREPAGRAARTPVIPRSVQRILFAHCEGRLDEAQELFQMRDAGRLGPTSRELTAIRDAVLYVLQICSGMRNSETIGVCGGCWRTEVRQGVAFHWVRTKEIKTRQGWVDFLVPPQALRALEILQRYAQPLQQRLAEEALWLEKLLRLEATESSRLGNGMNVAEAVQRLNYVREIGQCLFLNVSGVRSDHRDSGGRIDVMKSDACIAQLKALARAAGTDWELTNQQCRRTFAYNVANSRLGRMGLVFLKWQLKHASLSLTQLYASNPCQDQTLYRELEGEQALARVELMEGWLQPDALLSGGAGKKLMQTRATPVANLADLLQHAAEVIDIRSTGHAWCLSGTRGCHGQGVYDPSMCSSCSQAVIDRDQADTWQLIHLDNLRLAAITDCGPSVAQKAERAIKRSAQVLEDLGVPLPSQQQAQHYQAQAGDVR